MKYAEIGAAIGSAKGGEKLVPLRFTNVGNEAATIAYKHEAYSPSALISPNFTVIKDSVKTQWDYSAITLQPGEYLEIIGNNTSAISNKLSGPPVSCYFDIQGGSIEASGNIMSLLNPKAEIALPNNAFHALFFGCTSLATAPELPATTLAKNCYNNMFSGCTSLATAPELPATTLAEDCYLNMFYGCTSLATAPELPATTLAGYCYNSMFEGCTSLATAPELPATTLAEYCYTTMFSGCTSLATAPELPATTLARYCYSTMFLGCTSLATAPELPATTLAKNCYTSMFNGCTSLASVSAAFTNWDEENSATSNWLASVAATGTFTCPAGLDTTTRDGSHVPENWTVVNA